MKQAGYFLVSVFFLVLGFSIGQKFLQFQAIERAKQDARSCYHAGVSQKVEGKQPYRVWSKDYKLPASFSYPDDFPRDIEVRLDLYSNPVLFYVKPIYSLPTWIVVDSKGVVSVYDGDVLDLLQEQ